MSNNIEYQFVTWTEIDEMCLDICNQVKQSGFKPEAIVGLLRGGVIPARIFCDHLGILMDFFAIDVKLYDGIGKRMKEAKIREFEEDLVRCHRLLIVDDIFDSGDTMTAVCNHLSQENLQTATLFWKETAPYKPNYYSRVAKENNWIVFPWEKYEFEREKSK
jgi:hypoxanthine phosphoribosyltransferase